MKRLVTIGITALLAACHRQVGVKDVKVIQPNLSISQSSQEADIAAASRRTDSLRNAMTEQSSTYHTSAMSTCTPDLCAAIGRGELAIGMSRAGVFAVTNSMPAGWTIRGSETAGSMMPVQRDLKDRVSEVAMVTMRDGRVVSYTYREPSGLRTVSAPSEATPDARRRSIAQSLLDQGDAAIAAGNMDLGLEKYDQADVVEPNNPGTTLRIARLLDKQLRGVEALMRYQKFLHEMEIDRINAQGRANAELAGAVVAAQARVVHLVETTNRKP